MTGMDGKKDPGKFTVRFNLCDPQQRQAAELINQQGRSKAQFLTNAVLHYVHCFKKEDIAPMMNSERLRYMLEDILVQQKLQTTEEKDWPRIDTAVFLSDIDKKGIFNTLEAFQQQ